METFFSVSKNAHLVHQNWYRISFTFETMTESLNCGLFSYGTYSNVPLIALYPQTSEKFEIHYKTIRAQ
jgi:hypothetical protein